MKKTFALLLLGLSLFYLCPLLAQAQAGSEKRITISFHEAKLSSALKQLDEAFGGIYKIMFVYDEVDSHKVTVDIRNALPLDALSQVLKNTPFVYTVKDRFISVSLRQKSSEQKRALTGTVTDEQGEPLIGAGILIVGEKTGTVTNVDGVFKLQVPMDCKTLQVSYIGMATQLVDVVGKNTVQVRMKEDGMVLDNVVVTGYQTLSKERSAGSFDKMIISLMIPKGLAAAVLAGMPLAAGLPGGEFILNVTYTVVLFSITWVSILILLVDKSRFVRHAFEKMLGGKADTVDSIFMHDMERYGDKTEEDESAPAYEDRTAFGFLQEQEREQRREQEESKEDFVEAVMEYHQDEVDAVQSQLGGPASPSAEEKDKTKDAGSGSVSGKE